MADLILRLKREYFEQIRDGLKTEEYRLCTPYWMPLPPLPEAP